MEFKLPSRDAPKGRIHLAGRNAGGRHTGDLQIYLEPDVHGTPGDHLTLWWETGSAAGDIRKLVLPLNRLFPEGFPFDRYLKLNISWGDSGFKIEMDGKLLTEEKHNHTPCFSSPVHFTFGHSTTPAGKLYIRKISLEEQE